MNKGDKIKIGFCEFEFVSYDRLYGMVNYILDGKEDRVKKKIWDSWCEWSDRYKTQKGKHHE